MSVYYGGFFAIDNEPILLRGQCRVPFKGEFDIKIQLLLN